MRINKARLAALPPEKRKEAEAELAKLEHIYALNPLLTYRPLESQAAYHASRSKIKAFMGGNRSGKTVAGVVDDLIQAVDEAALPDHLLPYKRWQPPVKLRIVAPKFNENIEQVIFPLIRQWVPRPQLLDESWEKAFSKQRRVLTFANGSTIQFLTFEQDLDAHAGAALHRVHFDEEPEGEGGLQLYRETMQRLVDYDGDFCLTMTPLFGLSWAYDEIFERRFEDDISVAQADSLDNTHINRQAQEREFARMSKEERMARQKGLFVHFKGKFFEEFTDELHTVDPLKLSPKLPRYLDGQDIVVGIDPGLNRPGIVWVAFDSENAGLVFDEWCPENENMVVPELAEGIKRRNKEKWGGIKPRYVIDPSARNRATVNAEQVEAEFARAGIFCQHGQNDRAAGILEMKARLQHGSLLVSRDCPTLIREFERYRRDPNSADEFAAVKTFDDLLDATRYAVMSRVWHRPRRQRKGNNFNSNPMYEPPWRGPQPKEAPPLGVFS